MRRIGAFRRTLASLITQSWNPPGWVRLPAPFAENLKDYIKTYAPIGAPEEDLVRSLADSNWRLKRINAIRRTLLIRLETVEPEAYDETLKEQRLERPPVDGSVKLNILACMFCRVRKPSAPRQTFARDLPTE